MKTRLLLVVAALASMALLADAQTPPKKPAMTKKPAMHKMGKTHKMHKMGKKPMTMKGGKTAPMKKPTMKKG